MLMLPSTTTVSNPPLVPSALQRSPQPTQNAVRLATQADQEHLAAALVLAFADDPIMRWMYPDSHQYLTHFPGFVRAFGGRAFEQQTVYAASGHAGAAFWLPPGVKVDEQALIELFQRSVSEALLGDLFAVLEQMDHYHIHQPHWYLSLLAIEPVHQRRGYGSALMGEVLARCDRDQLPAYVESSKPDNIPFYQRHGFELLGTIQAGTSPPLFPMLRPPQ